MSEFFLSFGPSLRYLGLDEDPDDDSPLAELYRSVLEEGGYDFLNDETFASDCESSVGDWEEEHEKFAKLAESARTKLQIHDQEPNRIQNENQNQNKSSTPNKSKDVANADIEDNSLFLHLDNENQIVPKPGVWDSPPSLSLPRPRSPVSLLPSLKNICTVEELEKGLTANRTPVKPIRPVQIPQPPHQQPQQPQPPHKPDGSLLLESFPLNNKLPTNNLPPGRFPPGLPIPPPHMVMPPNIRFPHTQFVQHPRLLPNQGGHMLRYPPVPPHLMMPHGPQRLPMPGSFCVNFPQQPPPHNNVGPTPFLRPDHGTVPGFNNQNNHQQHYNFQHTGNQGNQNRSFHHSEQQSNHQPFFKNNQYPQRNYDRNNQRHYNRYSHGTNDANNSGEYDEYAGLMTKRDKQFLITVQLLQLNTNEPYVDDYYYTVFRDRQKKNNNGYSKESRERAQPPPVLTRTAYAPAQFENSLGKLQPSSVLTPRKIIDTDVVQNKDSQTAAQIQQRDTRKTRQLLLEIERLYLIQLKLEDLSNPLATLNQRQNQNAESVVEVAKKSAPELISSILSSLHQLIQDDKLTSMLSIRKAKTLLLRFLPHVNVVEYRSQLEELWKSILRGLPVIGRRDSQLLTSLYFEFQRWLNAVDDFDTLLRIAKALSETVHQSIKNIRLAFAITNKFGVSTIAAVIERAETLYASTKESVSPEWSKFIICVGDSIGDKLPCVAPCQPIAANTLNQHLNRIYDLKTEKHTTLRLLLTDANPSR